MAIKINFDTSNTPETPTFVLANRRGIKYEQALVTQDNVVVGRLNDASEISFKVEKSTNEDVWDDIVNLKLVWCKEWDIWFEIEVKTDETNTTIKSIVGTQLGKAELSHILLHDIEINTEADISRDDYDVNNPTVFYREDMPSSSLLHRISEKMPHYSFDYIAPTLANIQRSFTFDNISIYDALQNISNEIGCLFVLHSNSDENGNIRRVISAYDLRSNCLNEECGYRGEFVGVCPHCGGAEVDYGYGINTDIFITSDYLADSISYSEDKDAIKNCFKLEAGDGLMTSTVINCIPTGDDYIWRIPNLQKEDMSAELVDKLSEYETQYKYYEDEHQIIFDADLYPNYSTLISKYIGRNSELEYLKSSVTGYSELMTLFYQTLDFKLYLESELMPDITIHETNASEQCANLSDLTEVAAENIDVISSMTADNLILSAAKTMIDSSRYQIKIKESSYENALWTGIFTITSYTDEEDTADTDSVSITVLEDEEAFIEQLLNKRLSDMNNAGITTLFKMEHEPFLEEIRNCSLDTLKMLFDAAEACLDVLIEQGAGDKETWAADDSIYKLIYVPFINKRGSLYSEILLRESEIKTITYTSDRLLSFANDIHNTLDIKQFLGNDLWLELCSYRREDTYSNPNFISDGLSNDELFKRAKEFKSIAENELAKMSEPKRSITVSLRNPLVLDKFEPLIGNFETGNWILVEIDGVVYRLRLIEYKIEYNSIEKISVEFADITKITNSATYVEDVLKQASSMAVSFDYVKSQADQGASGNNTIKDWINEGLDTTNVRLVNGASDQSQIWDSHGMLFRKKSLLSDGYEPTQMKIVNSTISITDDSWESIKTAIGKFCYSDPETGEIKTAYGVNGSAIVGKLIIGESLSLYNKSGSLKFDDDGLTVSNGINTFIVNPNSPSVLEVRNRDGQILSFDSGGQLHINGTINADVLNATNEGLLSIFRFNTNGMYADLTGSGVDDYCFDRETFSAAVLSKEDVEVAYFYADSEIGSTTNGRALIYGNDVVRIGTNGVVQIYSENDFTAVATFDTTGNLSIDNNLTARNVYYTGSCSQTSDKREKNGLGELSLSESLTILNNLDIQKFTFKSDSDRQVRYGIFAQDLRDILSESGIGHIAALTIRDKSTGELITTLDHIEDDVTYSVDYTQFVPILMRAYKDMSKRIATMEKRVL